MGREQGHNGREEEREKEEEGKRKKKRVDERVVRMTRVPVPTHEGKAATLALSKTFKKSKTLFPRGFIVSDLPEFFLIFFLKNLTLAANSASSLPGFIRPDNKK